ncbi:uncharacterized protein LOC128741994 isoform X2 [Sabethes cyaneus]|uniref:uncharacterized protein LOC128738996 isoform X2 n=1 Tax=Sabethes cyaneus TaxID=53552 RepID=UPI00237E5953|nr:uncharacterized protein LOC128738996 isoform X2 [Sabethes cyaneus]XP_053694128.1 uncharacterized protein LOC128741994 isoform X2 [Sabethes cyaneus]
MRTVGGTNIESLDKTSNSARLPIITEISEQIKFVFIEQLTRIRRRCIHSVQNQFSVLSKPHPGLVKVKDDHDSDDFDDIKHAASSIVDGGVELEPNDRPILLDVLRKRTFSVEVHSLQRTLLSYKETKDCCQIYANDDCYSLLSSNRDLIKDAVSLGHCLWIK